MRILLSLCVLDLACRDLGDLDGGTDHVGGRFSPLGPRGMSYFLNEKPYQPENGSECCGCGIPNACLPLRWQCHPLIDSYERDHNRPN